MNSIVVADKHETLNDIVSLLAKYKPPPKIFKAASIGEVMSHMDLERLTAVLIDDRIERGLEICSTIKSNPTLNEVHTICFVTYPEDIDLGNPSVDQWYVKGDYEPSEVVASIEYLL